MTQHQSFPRRGHLPFAVLATGMLAFASVAVAAPTGSHTGVSGKTTVKKTPQSKTVKAVKKAMTAHSDTGVGAGGMDPFNGQSLQYEALVRKTRMANMQRKLAQSKLDIAQYKAKKKALGFNNSRAATGAARPGLSHADELRIKKLEQQVKSLQASRATQARKAAQHKARASVPEFIGAASSGHAHAVWLKLDKQVALVRKGGRLGQWQVLAIHPDYVEVGKGKRRLKLLPVSDWVGRARVTSHVGNEKQLRAFNAAQGSTPASRSALTSSGVQSVMKALSSR